MVLRTIVTVYDDLDNTEGASLVSFAYLGTSYEIDLGEENQAALHRALAKYIASARKAGSASAPARRRGRSKATTTARPDLRTTRTKRGSKA